MHVQQVHDHIDKNKKEDLDLLIKICKQPSVYAQNLGITEMCEVCCDLLRMIKMEPKIFPTNGAPIVYGELKSDDPNARTVLIYGHADVQPPEPLEEWNTPPWEPTVINNRLYGRGTSDNKGQFLTHILAIRSYLETNTPLPLNIKFIFELEEEDGSAHIMEFVEPNQEMLKADLLYFSDGGMHPNGSPIVKHGLRGMLQVEFDITTSIYDNHSGNKGGQIPNAAWEMVKFLSSLLDENGRCVIPGFYDGVGEVSDYNRNLIEKLPFDAAEFAKTYGVEEITLSKQQFYENLMFQPTFNINGLGSGYTGKGIRTIVPGHAICKMDIRLVGEQDPHKIFESLKDYVAKNHPNVKVTFRNAISPFSTDPELEVCKAVARAVRTGFGREPVIHARAGASGGPHWAITRLLGVPYTGLSFANADQNNHAPNENMDLDCFYYGIHSAAEIIWEVANAPKA